MPNLVLAAICFVGAFHGTHADEERVALLKTLAEFNYLAERQRDKIASNQGRLRRLENGFGNLLDPRRRTHRGDGEREQGYIYSDQDGIRANASALQGSGKAGASHVSARAKWWAEASAAEKIASMGVAIDHMYLILCGTVVMFMQVGFAALEAGTCRRKNVQNILLKNVADACIGAICWYVCGFSLAWGGVVAEGTIGDGFLGHGFNSRTEDGISPSDRNVEWFFQWTFCSAAATIVSGGVAERVRFSGFCIFGSIMTAAIYPVVVGSTWGGGWLSTAFADVNFIDFAGSGIVHFTGGVGALVGAIMAGPRVGRWQNPEQFAPHSLPLVVLGTMILWLGWYGFNCGSTLAMHTADQGVLAAHIAMNMTICAASAALTVFFMKMFVLPPKTYDVGALCNGILVGHVSITAGCSNVECGSACLIGFIGGMIYLGSSALLQRLHIDDPIDAFAVHGAGGAWGLVAASVFDWGKGFDEVHAVSGFDCMRDKITGACLKGRGLQLIWANLLELGFVALWAGAVSCAVFSVLRISGLLRAPDDVQLKGMDSQMVNEAYVLPNKYCEHELYPIEECSECSSNFSAGDMKAWNGRY